MRNHRSVLRRTPASAAALALPAAIFLLAGASFLVQTLQGRPAGTCVVAIAQSYASLTMPGQVVSGDELRQSKIAYALTLIQTLEAKASASPGGAASVSRTDLRQIRGALKAAGIETMALTGLP